LTARQREVLESLLRGLSEKEIAGTLMISRHTVHNHVKALYGAFDVCSRSELLAHFVRAPPGESEGEGETGEGGSAPAERVEEGGADLILLLDRDGRIAFVNHSMTGRRPEEMRGRHFLEWMSPTEGERFETALAAVFATGWQEECTVLAGASEATRRPYHVRLSPVKEEGEIALVVAVARETQGDEATSPGEMEDLRDIDADMDFRVMVELAPDRVLLVDRLGEITFINNTVTGYRRDELVGTNILDHVVPEDIEVVQAALGRAFETGRMQEYKVRARGADGVVRGYHVRLNPITREGQVRRVILIGRESEGEVSPAAAGHE